MSNFTCKNKRCKHNFNSSENKKVLQCPVCNGNVYNMSLIVTGKNFCWIESMVNNIERYGKNTFAMIDKCYPNPKVRINVRKMYFKTLEILKD